MSMEETVKLVREALKNHIDRDDIILEVKPVYSSDVVITGFILPMPRFKQIATVTHSVSIHTFIGIYGDVFGSIFVRKGKRLQAMLKKKFVVSRGKIVQSGYNKYIQQWIDEGIEL